MAGKGIGDRVKILEAENKELRRLWIENEGDIIKLKCTLQRFLEMKWYQRLFVKWSDWRLHRDIAPTPRS